MQEFAGPMEGWAFKAGVAGALPPGTQLCLDELVSAPEAPEAQAPRGEEHTAEKPDARGPPMELASARRVKHRAEIVAPWQPPSAGYSYRRARAGQAARAFRWMPAVGPIAQEQCGATVTSTGWRRLAGRVDECAALARTLFVGRADIVHRHMQSLRKELEGWKGDEESKGQVRRWLTAVANAIGRVLNSEMAGRAHTLSCLARMARAKAERWEAKAAMAVDASSSHG